MFRTAALRSAASAAARRSVVATTSRSFSSVVSRPALASYRGVAAAPVSRVAGWNSVRCYAAGSGLSKEDVEGRITSLLAGFDKVRFETATSTLQRANGWVAASLRAAMRAARLLWLRLVLPLVGWQGRISLLAT